LESENHKRLLGGTQQRLLWRKKESQGLPINRQSHHHALFHRWQAKDTSFPLKIAKNQETLHPLETIYANFKLNGFCFFWKNAYQMFIFTGIKNPACK
jgi:hypothetical protein